MLKEVDEILLKPFNLVVYHIGGGDGRFGLVERLTELFGENVLLIEFEIRSDDAEALTLKQYRKDFPPVISVSRCVGGGEREATFRINKYPLSSSLLRPSPLVLHEDGGFGKAHGATWSENTALDREIKVKTCSLSQIIKEFDLPPPDFLSIDAQGVELDILRGAKKNFEETILGAITEAEFFEIYEGQGLFHEQLAFYLEHGLRLVEPTSVQRWHPDARMPGRGFATVTEAFFIRFLNPGLDQPSDSVWGLGALNDLSDKQVVKLMAIARAFELYSYVARLGRYVLDERPGAQELLKDAPRPLADTLDFSLFVRDHLKEYSKNRKFFLGFDFDRETLQFHTIKDLNLVARIIRKLQRIRRAI